MCWEQLGGGAGAPKGAGGGGKHLPGGGVPFSYIPPAAIQNAMMTKDKKPFTYTPGGIDFLAEIRSPRMQRRISKNAADEGVANHQQMPVSSPSVQPQTPVQLSPQALMAMQPQMAVPVFPPTPQQMPVLHSAASPAVTSPPATPQHHFQYETPPPPPPQPVRINLKPAVPQFLQSTVQQQQQQQSPEQIIQESINSLPGRNLNTSPVQSPSSYQPVAPPPTPVAASFPERRNTQLGSIYIPPVTSTGSASSANNSNGHYTAPSVPISPLATAQLAKAPMPWMNSQNRTPSSPPPPFVNNNQERVIPIEREEAKPNVHMIPIAVEGSRTVAPSSPQRNFKDEVVHPPWHNVQGKVIPIHLEGAGPVAAPVQRQQEPYQQQQQQQAPWRTQAAANANQIASMMEE